MSVNSGKRDYHEAEPKKKAVFMLIQLLTDDSNRSILAHGMTGMERYLLFKSLTRPE